MSQRCSIGFSSGEGWTSQYIKKKRNKLYSGTTGTLHLHGTEEPRSCHTSMPEDLIQVPNSNQGAPDEGLCCPTKILQNFTDHSNPVKTGGLLQAAECSPQHLQTLLCLSHVFRVNLFCEENTVSLPMFSAKLCNKRARL